MTDRYERIRKALEMEPTPGAWYLDGEGVQAIVRDANGVIVAVRHRMPGHKNETNMRLIAACDPDTIRELLAERDALAAALEAAHAERDVMREALEDIRSRMRLDPFDRLAELDNIHQIADAALSAAERADGRTH